MTTQEEDHVHQKMTAQDLATAAKKTDLEVTIKDEDELGVHLCKQVCKTVQQFVETERTMSRKSIVIFSFTWDNEFEESSPSFMGFPKPIKNAFEMDGTDFCNIMKTLYGAKIHQYNLSKENDHLKGWDFFASLVPLLDFEKEGLVIIYYSGHGSHYGEDGKLLWSSQSKSFQMELLKTVLEKSATLSEFKGCFLYLLDCSHSTRAMRHLKVYTEHYICGLADSDNSDSSEVWRSKGRGELTLAIVDVLKNATAPLPCSDFIALLFSKSNKSSRKAKIIHYLGDSSVETRSFTFYPILCKNEIILRKIPIKVNFEVMIKEEINDEEELKEITQHFNLINIIFKNSYRVNSTHFVMESELRPYLRFEMVAPRATSEPMV